MDLASGQNTPLADGLTTISVTSAAIAGYDADVSIFVLDKDGKVRGDEDMIFHGQPSTPTGEIVMEAGAGRTVIRTKALPSGSAKVVVAIAGDDLAGGTRDLSTVKPIVVEIVCADGETHRFEPTETNRRALVLAEIYERNGSLRIKAVGQGFDGGLAPLARSYGVDVADPAPASAPAPVPTPAPAKVDLRKERLVSLEKDHPKLVSLAKAARVSLEKKDLYGTTAKVALALDISASMHGLYQSGSVDRLVQRVLGLALNLDDDGRIDAFSFGSGAYSLGEIDAAAHATFIPTMLRKRSLEGSTHYGKVMRMIREHYRQDPDFGRIPVFVVFVTDGNTQDQALTETQIREASKEGIFWKAIAIGEPGRSLFGGKPSLPRGFDFLQKLDDMPGRTVDNVDFFSVRSPDEPTDEELYKMLLEEYPEWLKAVKAKGILS